MLCSIEVLWTGFCRCSNPTKQLEVLRYLCLPLCWPLALATVGVR